MGDSSVVKSDPAAGRAAASSHTKKEPSSLVSGSQLAQLSDLIGHYGPYQAYLTLVLFSRYLLLGLMSNAGPLLAPDVNFYCELPLEEMISLMPNITRMEPRERDREIKEELRQVCQLDLNQYRTGGLVMNSNNSMARGGQANGQANSMQSHHGLQLNHTSRYRECTQFSYDPQAPDQASTLTTEFDLVCEREVLRSVFQSALSASIVVGHVFWGTFSDKYGRFTAQRWCLLISFLSGLLSLFARDFWTITIARVLCCFGDLGLVVSLTTNMVELVGSEYRGVSVSVVNFGSALGVALLPYIVSYYQDFRLVLMFTMLCHTITAPFILLTNESVRWLTANGRYDEAQNELARIWRWNSRHTRLLQCVSGNARTSARKDASRATDSRVAADIENPNQQQAGCISLVANQLSFVGRVNRLFRDKRLMVAVLTIVWTTFNSELLYTSFIIINLEVGENKYLNYLLGACMEALAAVVSSALLWCSPRRGSLITFWLLISATCFGLSVAHVDSHWAVWLLALAKFFQSTLSSIAMVAAYESFPTSLRQSGSGLVFTLGMLGSVFAPLIFTELDDQDHLDLVLMTFSLLSLSAGALVYWRLRETKGCELE